MILYGEAQQQAVDSEGFIASLSIDITQPAAQLHIVK
jgi:hypothetical protein